MKKRLRLLPITLLLVIGVVLSGCSTKAVSKNNSASNKTTKSEKADDTKELIDCLNKCKGANSVEASIDLNDMKMSMKMQDIHGDLKAFIDMDLEGEKQQFYLEHANDQYKIYMENGGQYYSKAVDSSTLDGINTDDSFQAYIDVVKQYPSMFKKEGKDTFVMDPSKSKMAKVYQAITGKSVSGEVDNVEVKFIIGDDGYLKEVDTKSGDITMTSIYSGFDTDLGIQIPAATEITQ